MQTYDIGAEIGEIKAELAWYRAALTAILTHLGLPLPDDEPAFSVAGVYFGGGDFGINGTLTTSATSPQN